MMDFNLKNVSFEEGTEEKQNAFCGIWETSKPGLQLLQSIIKNDIVKWVIGIVIVLGDRVAEKFCGTDTPG